VKNFLINNYNGSDGQHGGQGWSQDQLLLFASVWQSNKPRKVLDDSTFNRLDFYHHHRSEQKIARFRTHYFRDAICIREYSNLAKFNTFLLNHLWEIGPVENDLKEIC
jgi:hypothetical protein